MMKTAKLGKDSRGNPWVVETERRPYVKGTYSFEFWVYSAYVPPKRRNHPPAQALVIAESNTLAKLEYIGVDGPKRRLGIGSLLLHFIERLMAQSGVEVIYGEISDDPDLYLPYFTTLESYLTVLKRFYSGHGWTWQLFGDQKPRSVTNPHAIGRVERQIGS
jgi:GNAT superfamily N-acetyltransferase